MIARAVKSFVFAEWQGEIITVYRRAVNDRPYEFYRT